MEVAAAKPWDPSEKRTGVLAMKVSLFWSVCVCLYIYCHLLYFSPFLVFWGTRGNKKKYSFGGVTLHAFFFFSC